MDSKLPPVNNPAATEEQLTPTGIKVKNLFKGARSKNSGSTLNVDNIKSLVQWWGTLINPMLWKESRRFLSDKYLESTVMRTHDFELLKSMRNFLQAGDHLAKLIDIRVDEINKLIEDNRELFEQLAAEQKELEERQKKEAAAAGNICEDEGCPHFGTPHSHPTPADNTDTVVQP